MKVSAEMAKNLPYFCFVKILCSSWGLSKSRPSKRSLIVHFLLLLFAISSYKWSLQPCPHNRNTNCIEWLFEEQNLNYLGLCLITSSAIFVYLALAVLYLHYLPPCFLLLAILPSLIYLYNLGSSTGWEEHNGFNRLILISIHVLSLVSLCFMKLFVIITRKLARKLKFPLRGLRLRIISCFFIFCLINIFYRQNTGFVNYSLSPNYLINTSETNYHRTCKIYPPPIYILDIIFGFLNFGALSSCQHSFSLDWLPTDLRHSSVLGFPTLIDLSSRLLSDMPALFDYINDHIKDCSDIENCRSLEQFLFIKESKPRLVVNVFRNETKVKERKTLLNNNSASNRDKKSQNVLILFIDALSRPGFARTLPKTFGLLQGWSRKREHNVVSFLKFSSFAAFTEPNLIPFTFGINRQMAE